MEGRDLQQPENDGCAPRCASKTSTPDISAESGVDSPPEITTPNTPESTPKPIPESIPETTSDPLRDDPDEWERRRESGVLTAENDAGEVVDFHSLRHTTASRLAASGVSITTEQKNIKAFHHNSDELYLHSCRRGYTCGRRGEVTRLWWTPRTGK